MIQHCPIKSMCQRTWNSLVPGLLRSTMCMVPGVLYTNNEMAWTVIQANLKLQQNIITSHSHVLSLPWCTYTDWEPD